jgi:hypothetical protein
MTPDIPGAETVASWFGEWPSFHDAEILSVHINRGGRSQIRVYAFATGSRKDPTGHFVREHEAIVVFEFQNIRSIRLDGEDADVQNVLGGARVEPDGDGWRLELAPSYGLAGTIVAAEMSVRLERPA